MTHIVHAHRSVPDKSDRVYRWQRLFRGQESELRQLRHWLIELLPDSPGRDDLISVAVELGTNAVQHTASGDGGWFTVEVACLGPVLRVSVTDEGAERGPDLTAEDRPPAGPGLDPDPDPGPSLDPGPGLDPGLDPSFDLDLGLDTSLGEDGEFGVVAGRRCDRGRGLVIVRALAVSCGVCGNASGRTVWAEVAQTQTQAQAQAEPQAQAQEQAQPQAQEQAQPQAQEQAQTPIHTRTRTPIHTRTPGLSLSGPRNGQGRSSRPSASSAMAISRTL